MSSEAAFWQEIKRNIGHLGHWSRIESHSTSEGFPDTSLTAAELEVKIELKYTNRIHAPEIRPSQVRWFRKNVKWGGNPLLFVKVQRLDNTNYWLLFNGVRVVNGLYKLKKTRQWMALADYKWADTMDWDELWKVLYDSQDL